MKKNCIRIINILLAICLSFCLFLPAHFSYADELTPNEYINSGPGASDANLDIDGGFVQKYGGNLSTLLYGLAIIIAIICIMYVGLLYITGGITQKADYKKNLIPMFIGIFIVAFIGTILRIIANAASTV